MGCDIHLITQIKNKDKWEYVDDVPKSLNDRNYFTFAVLAGVRNDFDVDGFKPKGLPADLEPKKYIWKSKLNSIKNSYNTGSIMKVKLPDGTLIGECDEKLKRYCTEEETRTWKGSYGRDEKGHYVFDARPIHGEWVNIPYTELYTFEEYLNKYYKNEYDEEMQDYGWWEIDFECPDYHTPSYLTLKELLDFDYSDITKDKVKVPKVFLDKFFEMGGKMPEGMTVKKDWQPSGLAECFRQAFSPEYIVSWEENKLENVNILLFKGIEELKEIASKYDKTAEEVRIVFAFDN